MQRGGEVGGEEKVEDGGRPGEPFGKFRQHRSCMVTSAQTQGPVCAFPCLLAELVGIGNVGMSVAVRGGF